MKISKSSPFTLEINIVSQDSECDHETTAICVPERKPESSLLKIKEIILQSVIVFYRIVSNVWKGHVNAKTKGKNILLNTI